MRTGVAQGGIFSPVLFSLYVNDMPTLSRHDELALYADDTALVATSRRPSFSSILGGFLLQARALSTGLEDIYQRLKSTSMSS
jgi:hypothetical protein